MGKNQKANVFKLGTFNVRGLSSEIKKNQLSKDIKRYGVDICCLQETKIRAGIDTLVRKDRLICLPSDVKQYGLGFMISNRLADCIYRYWKVSDRISVLQVKMKPKQCNNGKNPIMTIINVYAPHIERLIKDT